MGPRLRYSCLTQPYSHLITHLSTLREIVASLFSPHSYKFNDLQFSDSETFKVVIRMFMDFNLINQYQIPYRVSQVTRHK